LTTEVIAASANPSAAICSFAVDSTVALPDFALEQEVISSKTLISRNIFFIRSPNLRGCMSGRNSIIDFLRSSIFTRENLWAVILAVMILLIFTCGTIGVQPRFIYTGF
jgi:hypothetical protein